MRTPPAAAIGAAMVLLAPSGCIKQMLVDSQIGATREASSAVDTIGDYETARMGVAAGLTQFEGLHALSPDNDDALYLLAKGWGGYAYGFLEDEIEVAHDAGDDDTAEYNRRRARLAFDRAVFYGLQLMRHRADGFEQARKTAPALTHWLEAEFTSADDAPGLLWTGYAWLARADLMKGDDEEGPAFVAELFVGAALLERAVALDPGGEHAAGLTTLGSYHARSNMAELDQSKRDFDDAAARTGGRDLLVQFNMATKYACVKGDTMLYVQTLEHVLQAEDPDPSQRLQNAIAKRRARRWLTKRRAKDECGIDLPGAPSTPADREPKGS